MKDFIGRTIFERDLIVYCTRRRTHARGRTLVLAVVLAVERDRIQVAPLKREPVWLRQPEYIAILTEPQEWELA